MKRTFSIITAIAITLTVMVMPVFASHGGGHHRGSRVKQPSYKAPSTSYGGAGTYSAPSNNAADVLPLVAAVCNVQGCTIIGEHAHNGGSTVTHYYGDGHDYHGEYDHYYGDGHDYHEQYEHYYGDGHEHHNQYDHYYGDGHSYHTKNGHAYHAGELHH